MLRCWRFAIRSPHHHGFVLDFSLWCGFFGHFLPQFFELFSSIQCLEFASSQHCHCKPQFFNLIPYPQKRVSTEVRDTAASGSLKLRVGRNRTRKGPPSPVPLRFSGFHFHLLQQRKIVSFFSRISAGNNHVSGNEACAKYGQPRNVTFFLFSPGDRRFLTPTSTLFFTHYTNIFFDNECLFRRFPSGCSAQRWEWRRSS